MSVYSTALVEILEPMQCKGCNGVLRCYCRPLAQDFEAAWREWSKEMERLAPFNLLKDRAK